jgi:hypothetical protein
MGAGGPKPVSSGIKTLRNMFFGWILFNGLLLLVYLGFQRYTQLDTWKLREPVARWVTFNTWVAWPDITPPEIQMAGRNRAVQRMDTDGDGFEEWVVEYEYDLAVQRSPVAVAIYDNDRGTPPVLYPYRLVLPDRDYASETSWWGTNVKMGDYVKGDPTGQPEILVHGVGPPEEFALFRYDATRKSQDWMDPRDYPPVYRCIGYFRGDSIKLPDEDNDVIITRRVAYDRSQLAIKERYRYDAARDTYLDTDEKTLLPKVESWVDFAFAEPVDVASSEYPEKVVLAFYKRFPNGDVAPFMSRQAREYAKIANQTLDSGAYGLPVMPDRIDRILIQTLAYTPQAENQPYIDSQGVTRFGALVHVEFFYTLKDVPDKKRWYSIKWFVIQEEGNWRLDHIEP